MSEAAVEEVSVLSSIYCGEGEFQLIQQSAQDGLMVQINSTFGEGRGLDIHLLFHLHPRYPSCPPDISVSSTGLSRAQCHNIRQKLLDQAATLAPEPMVHQLVEWLQQCVEVPPDSKGGEEKVQEREKEEWTAVLSLDHIRSRNHYIGMLERWTEQLQLTGRLLLGRHILVILHGARPKIKVSPTVNLGRKQNDCKRKMID